MPQRDSPFAGASLSALGALARMLAARFSEDRCFQVAASLTFTVLLSLVPLITVALTVVSVFPVFEQLTGALQHFLIENIVPQSAEVIVTYARRFAANAGRLTVIGIFFVVVTAVMLLHTIENEFNLIWRVARRRPLLQRVLVYLTLLAAGPVLIGASLSLTSWLVSLSLGLASEVPGGAVLMLEIVPVLLTSAAFALVYLALPNRRVKGSDACLGGFAAGVGFEVMKDGFAQYLAHFPTYQVIYGAFAAVPIFLLWIYLSWLLLIGGAVLVAALPEWRAGAWRAADDPGSDFVAALALLETLHGASHRGNKVPLAALCAAAGLPAERAERLLDAMAEANWIARAGAEAWAQSRAAGEIRLVDLYHRFVLAPNVAAATQDEKLRASLSALADTAERALSMTLEERLTAAEHGSRAGEGERRCAARSDMAA